VRFFYLGLHARIARNVEESFSLSFLFIFPFTWLTSWKCWLAGIGHAMHLLQLHPFAFGTIILRLPILIKVCLLY
jgi:hypothetical protein